jgi:hypothetical protein
MKLVKLIGAAVVAAAFAAPALAQTTGEIVQRNVNQQERIEQGLQSGQLTTGEAARLEGEEARVEKLESRALKDGKLSAEERARIDRAQNQMSRDIYREKHDAQVGNPNSPSSQRMQADVQRNINQQQRIAQGIKSGALTNREVGKLERGQARDNAMQYRAGRDGYVGPHEQRHIQSAENRQSARIYREKHDAQKRH